MFVPLINLQTKIKMTRRALYAFLMLFVFTLVACEKEDPDHEHEEEVITTLTYTLQPDGGGSAVTLSFKDLDGDGGNAPIISGGDLAANTIYSGNITLLNESESPAEDITEEIEEEEDEHQFFFSSTVAGVSVAYNDKDDDNNPIGLKTKLTTGTAGAGNLTVILRHEPNKDAAGVSSGDISNAGGETDIEVTFPIEIK